MSQSYPTQQQNKVYNTNSIMTQQKTSVASLGNLANQTLTGTAAVLINLPNVVIASTGPSITTNASTSSMTINDAGVYRINLSATLTPSAVGQHTITLLSGITIIGTCSNNLQTIGSNFTMTIGNNYSLAAGAVISVTATQPTAGTCAIQGVTNSTIFSISKVM
jgi:hypothetical protein